MESDKSTVVRNNACSINSGDGAVRRRRVSPPSTMTLADVLATSTVRTSSASSSRSFVAVRRTDTDSSSDGSSPGSTVTATTVRTAIQKSSKASSDELSAVAEDTGGGKHAENDEKTPSDGSGGGRNGMTQQGGRRTTASSRSVSRPPSARPRSAVVNGSAAAASHARARSVSQCGQRVAMLPREQRRVKVASPAASAECK